LVLVSGQLSAEDFRVLRVRLRWHMNGARDSRL
jgi:hypothetical protein